MFSNYDIDDTSSEAKKDRREKAKMLKIVIIFFCFVLLAQQVGYFFFYYNVLTPYLVLMLSVFSSLWIWCIYNLWNTDFSRKEDREDE